MTSPSTRSLQNFVEFLQNPPPTAFPLCPSLPSHFLSHLLSFPLFRPLCPFPLPFSSPAFFLLPPPLLNSLFLHFLNSSANLSSSVPSALPSCFSSIESLLFEQKERHKQQKFFSEKHYDVPCPSSAQSVPSLGQQREAINQKCDTSHDEIAITFPLPLRPSESNGSEKGKIEEKSAQWRGEQRRSREDKKRRKGGQQKVCFGLTTEEKAQIRATEANGERAEGFCCFRCGKVFSYEYYRDKHLKFTRCVDNGNRRFPCSLCSRSFEKRDRLRIHILHVHERYRPHGCPLCSKAFSQSSSLNKVCVGIKHLRTHSGERPYQCPHCEKAFTASSILRTHIRQHSGEKPFKCAICGKCFASHAAHDSHIRRTHNE